MIYCDCDTSSSWSAPLLYTLHECRQAIHRLGLAKAAGPGGLPAEFYESFEDLVVCDLHNTLVEAHAEGARTPYTLTGVWGNSPVFIPYITKGRRVEKGSVDVSAFLPIAVQQTVGSGRAWQKYADSRVSISQGANKLFAH